MDQDLRCKRGAPVGNQNARKHGFYSNVLDRDQKLRLKEAALVNGIDEEINLLRVKLKSVVERDPDNVRLISHAAISLGRLLRIRERLNKGNERSMVVALRKLYGDDPEAFKRSGETLAHRVISAKL